MTHPPLRARFGPFPAHTAAGETLVRMAHPHLELLVSSRDRIAASAARVRQSAARITVHFADPSAPPTPPPGAIATVTKDADTGRILSFGWVVAEIGRDTILARTFNLRDELAPRLSGA